MLPFPQTRVPCGTAAPSSHVVNQLVPAQEVVLVPERAGGTNRVIQQEASNISHEEAQAFFHVTELPCAC